MLGLDRKLSPHHGTTIERTVRCGSAMTAVTHDFDTRTPRDDLNPPLCSIPPLWEDNLEDSAEFLLDYLSSSTCLAREMAVTHFRD